MKRQEIIERMERCRKFNRVTPNGVVYDEHLAGPDGMNFTLFREAWQRREDLEKAAKRLKFERDVCKIRIQKVN